MDGAEEDGVDNRVEAPSRVPGEEPGETAAANGSDSTLTSESVPAADAAASPAGQASLVPDSGWQVSSGVRAPSAAPPAPSPAQPTPAFYPSSGPATGGAPGSAQAQAMAAVAGAATGARNLASRVGSSFSGLTKPKPAKPKPAKPKPPPVRRPPSPAGRRPLQAQSASRPPQPGQPTRRALLSLERIEPMSVMKFSFLISLVGWVIMFVAVAVIYFSLSKIGVFTKIEQTWGLVTYNKDHPGSNLTSWFRASTILEYTALVCTINAILFTALATIGAALYNLVTNLTGGIEVTLKESD
jgi:Transmembrane domain of unknown function (DUF3566)